MKYFGCCLVLFSLCLMGFGPNETPQTNPGQKLGELWEGLKANSPDVSEAFKDQIFEIPVLVLNDCSSDSPRTDAGGQISLIALTPMESEALSGPQRFTLRLSRQQYSDLKIGQSSSLLQWATVEVVADTFLYHDRLVLAVNPDKKQAEFKDGPTLWGGACGIMA